MSSRPMLFGTELRRRRVEAGYSLADMTKLVHYSKSHLSKVETGAKPPSADLARRCDALLECDGELVRLAQRPAAEASVMTRTAASEVWVLRLDDNGGSGFVPSARREVLATGLFGGLAGVAGWSDAPAVGAGGGAVLGWFRLMFVQLRRVGQQVGPDTMLPILTTYTHALSAMGRRARGRERTDALMLAARFAEYTGWMAQEGGLDGLAGWWTDRAVDLADAAGDAGMAAYALVRRALLAMYQQDPALTIVLARAAQTTQCGSRVRGLAARREAQGHALANDRRACFAALDRARDLLTAEKGEAFDGLVLGSMHVVDPVAAATGWCLFDLGNPKAAAQTLREELAHIPSEAHRTRARFGARLALALASSAQLDEACAVSEPMLDEFDHVRSATIRADLRHLARTLRRWPDHAPARRVSLRLTAALHTSVAGRG